MTSTSNESSRLYILIKAIEAVDYNQSLVVGKGDFPQIDYFTKISHKPKPPAEEPETTYKSKIEQNAHKRNKIKYLLSELLDRLPPVKDKDKKLISTLGVLNQAVSWITQLEIDSKKMHIKENRIRQKYSSLIRKRQSLIVRRRMWIKNFVQVHWKESNTVPNLSPTKTNSTSEGGKLEVIEIEDDDARQADLEDQPCCSSSLSK